MFHLPISKLSSDHRTIGSIIAFVAIIVLLLFNPLITVANSGSSQVTFSTPVNLSSDKGSANYPNVQALGSYVYVTWSEGGGGILFKASDNYGATWNVTRKISTGSGTARYPLMSDNGSNVYVVWAQQVSGDLQIFESTITDHGYGTISTRQITTGTEGFTVPVIASWGSDIVVGYGNGSVDDNSWAWYVFSTNAGSTWSKPSDYGLACPGSGPCPEPQAYMWGTNMFVVADNGFVYSANDGSTWNYINVNGNYCYVREPWIWGYGPNVYVSWYAPPDTTNCNGNGADIYVTHSNNDGKTWTNASILSTDGQINPMVWAYGNSAWIATVQSPGGSSSKIWVYTTTNGGATWSQAVLLSGSGQTSYPWTVSSSDGQNVFVGFSQKTSGGNWAVKVGYSSTGGGGAATDWTPNVVASVGLTGNSGVAQDTADAGIASSGTHCYAVWQYSTSGTSQIYFSST